MQKEIDIVSRRRLNLEQWIKEHCKGVKANFVELTGINQGELSSLLKDKSFGEKKARKIEAEAGMPFGWLDADNFSRLSALVAENQQPSFVDSVEIPLMNAYGSAGAGNEMPVEDVVIDILRTSRAWLEKMFKPELKNINSLRYIHAIGDSMSPTFDNGDVLLVDTSAKGVKADRIFVLEAHGRLFIKRVRQRIDGSFEISSDNPAVKTVDILNGDTEVSVIGQVIWVWNGKRL